MKKRIPTPILTLLGGLLLGYLFFSGNQEPEKGSAASQLCAAGDNHMAFICSMHPQVKQAEKGHCPLCGMPLVNGLDKVSINPYKIQMSEQAVKLASIETAVVGSANGLQKEIRLEGKVVPDEKRIFHQVAHLPGRIEKLYVHEEGEYVSKGQPIASVYSRELIGMMETFEYSKSSDGVLRSAINNIKAWKVSEEQLKKFDIKKGDYHKAVDVFSEFSGVVLKKYVTAGDHAANDYMAEATRMFDIADLSRVWVLFDVYESDLGWVKKGDAISFTVPAFPGRTFRGNIARISPSLDPLSRTSTVRIEVNNTDGLLKPEMLATGTLKVSRKAAGNNGLTIPQTAVLWTGERSIVYVKDPEFMQPVFEYREVVLGTRLGESFLVEKGLEAGEEVVVNGVFRVDASAELAGKKSMMSEMRKQTPVSKEVKLVRN